MKKKDLCDVYFRLRCAVNALVAVHTALEHGPNDPTEFHDAVYGIADYMDMLLKEMEEVAA